MLFKILALIISDIALCLALNEWLYVREIQKRLQERQKEEDEEWNVSWFH